MSKENSHLRSVIETVGVVVGSFIFAIVVIVAATKSQATSENGRSAAAWRSGDHPRRLDRQSSQSKRRQRDRGRIERRRESARCAIYYSQSHNQD